MKIGEVYNAIADGNKMIWRDEVSKTVKQMLNKYAKL